MNYWITKYNKIFNKIHANKIEASEYLKSKVDKYILLSQFYKGIFNLSNSNNHEILTKKLNLKTKAFLFQHLNWMTCVICKYAISNNVVDM